MMRGRTLAAAGAALALITGAGVAYAATISQTATCTAAPTITDGGTSQSIDVTCSWPKPPAETVTSTVTNTATVTATQTVTATPAPVTTTPNSTTSSTTPPPATTTPPAPAAWPDASTTGVPAGTVLTNRAGSTITTAGTVIDGANITGTVRIAANNVTIKNSRITGSGYDIVKVVDGVTGTRLERVEIDGKGKAGASGSNGVYGAATLVGVNIRGVENGVQPDGPFLMRDSWIHDLDSPGSPHIDGVQVDGGRSNITIEHNTVDLRGWTQTAAVMIDNYFGAVDRVTVNNNRLLGGGYTTYIDARFGRTVSCSGCTGQPITNVAYTNNRIGYGYWGAGTISGTGSRDSYTWSGNVSDATGAPIPAP